jgi:hypothetical protein
MEVVQTNKRSAREPARAVNVRSPPRPLLVGDDKRLLNENIDRNFSLRCNSAAVVSSTRAQVSADLAKQRRAMMVKAHPSVLYGQSGTAALQRQYFGECIKRQGKTDDGPEPGATPDRHRPY